ncbi:hypothetical protein ACERK3_09705 [Phycisphaerales bacterium AB-hyl4]|uniref:DNA primase/polymerase bifunctional N-terminal domain-containing protein n=1 Tax=Natronomicrosphaera hydrolytica TaxID=3242702 RepID=A0ABV4U5Y3_9BACT
MKDPITVTDALLDRIHLLPDDLIKLDQWGLGRNEDGRKIPCQSRPPYRRAKVNAPDEWGTFSEAVDAFADRLGYADQFHWLAFLFTADDPFIGIDLDDCVVGDVIHPEARKLIDALGGYSEVSPSGTGIKAWVTGKLPIPDGKTGETCVGPWGGKLEIYRERRWFAVTGWRLDQ